MLFRKPFDSLTSFLVISFGCFVLNLILVIETSIKAEFSLEQGRSVPDLFFFDIQEDQVGKFQKTILEMGASVRKTSPLVRARLQTINGAPIEKEDGGLFKTREAEQSERSANRTFNLTEFSSQYHSGQIIEGREPHGSGQGTALEGGPGLGPATDIDTLEITVEEQFGKRLNLEMGSVLGFDILGVELKAKIVGIRKIRWADFDPNFFIEFQPGSFENVPKVFLSSVVLPDGPKRIALQKQMALDLPNVSAVEISKLISEIFKIVDKMALAIKFMSGLALLSAFFVIFSIRKFHLKRNEKNRSMLNLLGVDQLRLRAIKTIESSVMLGGGLFVGWFLGLLASWPILRFVFARPPKVGLDSYFLLMAVTLPLSLLVGSWVKLKGKAEE